MIVDTNDRNSWQNCSTCSHANEEDGCVSRHCKGIAFSAWEPKEISDDDFHADAELNKAIEAESHVNHPKHYNREGSMECIDEIIEFLGAKAAIYFCLCNAWKYRYRSSSKGGEEDIRKSDWYTNRAFSLLSENGLICELNIKEGREPKAFIFHRENSCN